MPTTTAAHATAAFVRQRAGQGAILLALAAAALGPVAAWALPTFAEVRAAYRPSDTLVLARDGQVLQRQRTDDTVRRGAWTTLAEVSPALRMAMVLSEDKRFYDHSGIDWAAVSAAAWGNLFHQRTRGASTISMQLVGLIDDEDAPRAGQRSLLDKAGQAVSSQVLDRRWRKDEVLEAYLNLVPFRGEVVGITALSQTLFGKAPHGLDEREAAIAAALVRAPNAAPARVAQRACGVWREMLRAQRRPAEGSAADCATVELLTQAALLRRPYAASSGIAPHAARQVLRAWPQAHPGGAPLPAAIATTLDARLQRIAVQSLGQHLRELRRRNVNDGAVVVLDNASGEVLAYVGSSGELSQAREVDAAAALRQPGSTLKPFLYAQALAEQRITAASLLDDAPTHIATQGGLYIPQNYDRHFKGWVSARTALASSLNVPAVRLLAMVTPDAFARQLRTLGLALPQPGDYYGFSLALGSAEVSLLALTNAYRTLANGGRAGEVRFLPGVPAAPGAPAIDARAAFVVGDMLSDANARARTFGTNSVLATRFWTAVKTGTSKDMRDNWVIGWSRDYTVGVWVGNAEGQAMWDVSGTSGAAPVWADLMAELHRSRPSLAPAPPAGLVQERVAFGPAPGREAAGPLEAARNEWFLAGTEQTRFAPALPQAQPAQAATAAASPAAVARIVSPVSGTIIALDPDIPPAHQRLTFKAQGDGDLRWLLDGRPFGRGAQLPWLPIPGRHQVQLVSARGEVLDAIVLEVRGAGFVAGR
ncbi:MAG: Penicillin-binding protein 1C [Paracidovorax wautersii]|uniref:peptidoglycan glycosyltransferase n=1 Tax=Paracidovorax wautersii TaxID=1177982 RepID=A0A7V8JQR1_9BURK|nr:MAG: Penicillin-binding protein 1C [Paracidovorax wautersii]